MSRNAPALAPSKTIDARIDEIMNYRSQKTQKQEKLNLFYSRNAVDLQQLSKSSGLRNLTTEFESPGAVHDPDSSIHSESS